ncbi:PH domain-containing protein [Psychrobacter sp. JCM 18901]|uniref:PH domain-containing protein n=1 Tax=Psychrobacter sp. JCM 18901 TaxID=1298609 RepID=UPI0021C3B7BA|nr:PH domain-containing protein [Psychrobacter sp. JCM 18901]
MEITDIIYITPTRSMSSAPALSLDRIKIVYKNEEILISPKDKLRFYREIQARNPSIAIDEAGE